MLAIKLGQNHGTGTLETRTMYNNRAETDFTLCFEQSVGEATQKFRDQDHIGSYICKTEIDCVVRPSPITQIKLLESLTFLKF